MKDMFESMDQNGDGRIDECEFSASLKKLNIPVGESQVRMIFEVYDVDKSASLDYSEFLVLLGYETHDGRR